MSSAKAALESDTRVGALIFLPMHFLPIIFIHFWFYHLFQNLSLILLSFPCDPFRCLLLKRVENTELESTQYLPVRFLSLYNRFTFCISFLWSS